jgi:hypothetical protein
VVSDFINEYLQSIPEHDPDARRRLQVGSEAVLMTATVGKGPEPRLFRQYEDIQIPQIG